MTTQDGVFIKKRGRFNMTRSFGPIVRQEPSANELILVATCGGCIMRKTNGGIETCTHHRHDKRAIENPHETPEWCTLKAAALADATDMINGTEHKIWRWSGMKTHQPRVIFSGMPSEAAREYRRTYGEIRQGWISLINEKGETLQRFVKTEGPKTDRPNDLFNTTQAKEA